MFTMEIPKGRRWSISTDMMSSSVSSSTSSSKGSLVSSTARLLLLVRLRVSPPDNTSALPLKLLSSDESPDSPSVEDDDEEDPVELELKASSLLLGKSVWTLNAGGPISNALGGAKLPVSFESPLST